MPIGRETTRLPRQQLISGLTRSLAWDQAECMSPPFEWRSFNEDEVLKIMVKVLGFRVQPCYHCRSLPALYCIMR